MPIIKVFSPFTPTQGNLQGLKEEVAKIAELELVPEKVRVLLIDTRIQDSRITAEGYKPERFVLVEVTIFDRELRGTTVLNNLATVICDYVRGVFNNYGAVVECFVTRFSRETNSFAKSQ